MTGVITAPSDDTTAVTVVAIGTRRWSVSKASTSDHGGGVQRQVDVRDQLGLACVGPHGAVEPARSHSFTTDGLWVGQASRTTGVSIVRKESRAIAATLASHTTSSTTTWLPAIVMATAARYMPSSRRNAGAPGALPRPFVTKASQVKPEQASTIAPLLADQEGVEHRADRPTANAMEDVLGPGADVEESSGVIVVERSEGRAGNLLGPAVAGGGKRSWRPLTRWRSSTCGTGTECRRVLDVPGASMLAGWAEAAGACQPGGWRRLM